LETCFIVRDSAGQKLAYLYFEDEPGRRSAAKLLSAIHDLHGSHTLSELTANQICAASHVIHDKPWQRRK
jgi:hypothetical protein